MKLSIALLIAAMLLPSVALAQDQATPAMIGIIRPPTPPGPPGDGWVWIPATYRTVWEWVWRDPIYRTVSERHWVPDEYGWRPEEVWENGAPVKHWNWVIIRPGHWEMTSYQVQVSPGRWVYEAHQVVVTAGHWEWRPTYWPEPRPISPPPSTVRPPELQPFSPLWEWPDSSKKS